MEIKRYLSKKEMMKYHLTGMKHQEKFQSKLNLMGYLKDLMELNTFQMYLKKLR
jgi:hypothetical protein